MFRNLHIFFHRFIGRAADHRAPLIAEAEAYRKEGNAFLEQGDVKNSEACFRRAIAVDPNFADVHVNLGFVLLKQKRLDEARYHLRLASSLAPDNADAHYLLGVIAYERGYADESAGHFRKAIQIKSDFAEAHNALGAQFRVQRKIHEALICFDNALTSNPEFLEPHCEKGRALLFLGDYEHGLALLERRFDATSDEGVRKWLALLASHPEKLRWRGGDLGGKTLLLWMEQGAGDCLMMMRYLWKLKDQGIGKLVVLSDPSLARLIQTFPAVSEVTSHLETLSWDSFDAYCSFMSLPFVFGTRLDTIPNTVPYLFLPKEVRGKWSERLSPLSGLRVGLTWAGNPNYGRDAMRSVSLREFDPLLSIPDVSFVSLQKGDASRQLKELDLPIADWMEDCEDYMDTAALVAELDLVISVDTSVAHLAGALGKPVWLLNRFESEWRWLLDREDSPWYPTMKIFNQPRSRDWARVVDSMRTRLEQLAALGRTFSSSDSI